ncbi:MAG: hypothetical protein ABI675_05345 [Chitinophagaceae bacterium]
MKQDLMHSLVPLKKEELQKLCCEVKETLATGIVFPKAEVKAKEASFGIADLWSLQRKMKTAGRLWNNRNRNFFIR